MFIVIDSDGENVISMKSATKLNAVQLHLLELFSGEMTDKELADVKGLLKDYYAKRVDEDMDMLWEQRGWNDKTVE